jgi:tetratricopeptide (TPR) repeat protein
MEETENFAFESTVPRHVFESYRDLFEEYFGVFVKMWKIKKPKDLGPLKVQFFIDREDFMQITGMPRGVGGFFRFVEPFELAIFYDPTDPRMTEEVIYHELGHYLQKLIEMDFKYPHWPGESISEYYGASNWNPAERELTWGGLHESRISQIKKDIESGKWVYVEPMIRGANDRNFEDYSWGWSFVHYMLSTKEYESNFKKFIIGLARARDIDREAQQMGTHRLKVVSGDAMLEAFMKYMKLKSPDDLKELEREWHAYIEEELTISSWRGLAGSAWLNYQQGRVQRAKRLYQEAVDAGADGATVFHKYATVLADDGMHKSAHERWKQAVAFDPLVPAFYIAWGSDALQFEDTRAEGERMLKLARELDPDNYYLERNLEQLLKRKAKGKLADRPQSGGEAEAEDADDADGTGEGTDGGDDSGDEGDGTPADGV